MIANVTPHRRANAFAQALEDRTPSDLSEPDPAAEQSEAPAEPADHDRLLALASVLGERMPRPVLDPEVKVVQRAQLVAAMEAKVMEERAGGGAAEDPLVPEQRTGRGAHRATSLRKLRPRSRWSKGIAAGASPWVWPQGPSAEWPLPAPTPCPVTPSTPSSGAWRI